MRKTNHIDYILSATLSFIPKIIMIITASYPLRVTGDELFMFYLPAKLAGLNWSESMFNYRYYGYGFNIFLTPLFKYVTDAVILYRWILIIVAALQMIIPIICCYLLRNCFKSTNIVSNILIALICTYMVALYPTYMYNEHIYIICVWFSFFCLYKLLNNANNKKGKMLYSAMLGLSFVLSLTIHQRGTTLFYAFVIVYILYALLFKAKIAYIIPTLLVYFIGAYIDKQLVAWNVAYLKDPTALIGEISNTDTNFEFSFSWFLDKDYTDAFFKTFIGNLNNWNIFTLGFGSFSIFLGIWFLYRFFTKKITKSEKMLLVIGLFGFLCIGITIFGLAITWGWGIREAYVSHDASSDSLRGLVYLRYLVCYYPPVLLGVLVYIKNNRNKSLKLFRYASFFSALCAILWMKKIIVPLLLDKAVGLGCIQPFSLTSFETKEISSFNYLFGLLIIGLVSCVALFLLKHRTINGALIVLLCFVLVPYLYHTYIGDGRSMIYNKKYSDGATEVLEEFRTNNVSCPIYVQAYARVPETGQNIMYQLQFMNMHTKLSYGIPLPDLDEAVYFTYYYIKEHDSLLEQGYVQYQIDDNEYAYVKGESLRTFFENSPSVKRIE